MTPRALTVQGIERAIHLVRGQRVMLDADLARLYGVETGALNRAVKRNRTRFPDDFMFQVTSAEAADLKCQIGISSGHGGRRRSTPYAFTEHGVVMLSSVLNSARAVAVTFCWGSRIRRPPPTNAPPALPPWKRRAEPAGPAGLAINVELADRLAAIEVSLNEHRDATGGQLAEHEGQIQVVLEAIQKLMEELPREPAAPIGFEVGNTK